MSEHEHDWGYISADELQHVGHYGAVGYAYCRTCGLRKYDDEGEE